MEPHKFAFTKGLVKPRRFQLGFVPDKDAQKQALKASGQGDLDLYDLISEAIAAGMAASGYGIEHAYKAASYIPKIALDGIKADDMHRVSGVDKTSSKRNPLLPTSDRKSPVTHAYLVSRRLKKIGGNVLQGVSSAMSAAPLPTAVNIPGTIYHSHALILTGVHVARIEYISRRYISAAHSDASLVRDWCALIRSMKTIKTAVRGTQLVGSVIPMASIPTSIASSVAKMGIKLTTTGACYAAAAHLQYMAFREQGFFAAPVSLNSQPPSQRQPEAPWARQNAQPQPVRRNNGPGGAPRPRPSFTPMRTIPEDKVLKPGPEAGPASSIIWEIFTKRGATRLLGKYDVAALIEEPAGWMALADKLLLI